MNVFSLYLEQNIEKYRRNGASELAKPKGQTAASATVTSGIQTDVFMNFFRHFMVMGRQAENTIFITLKITEVYKQSTGEMIDQCCRPRSVRKGVCVLLKLDNVSLLLKMKNVLNKHVI